jgi:imidazole glycerol-phosphate synthase subunit HisH
LINNYNHSKQKIYLVIRNIKFKLRLEQIISNKSTIGIIDYGAGNITSVANALNYLKVDNALISSADDIKKFSKVILPGVGSFERAMKLLKASNLDIGIKSFIENPNNRILGICLGMQLFYEFSEEDGGCEGLGIIKGTVNKLPVSDDFKIPNVGWREISLKSPSALYKDITSKLILYFVHSYACHTIEESSISGTLDYNGLFSCSLEQENIFAVQFHPEKSHSLGLQILSNFIKL